MYLIQLISIIVELGNTPLRRLLQLQIGALITDIVSGRGKSVLRPGGCVRATIHYPRPDEKGSKAVGGP